jgi:hypothetical protein
MAVIGLRAGALVSFNVEMVSAVPIATARGGNFVSRTYRRSPEAPPFLRHATDGGATCPPVFFPHGLLDMHGDCVFTKSEYDAHRMSLAVGTAVNMCLGGSLLILGMSLDDAYLRDAILHHRRWIKDVFWVTNSGHHDEWARVANVHRVPTDYATMWKKIAETILANDPKNELHEICAGPKGALERAVRGVKTVRAFLKTVESTVTGDDVVKQMLEKHRPAQAFAMYRRQCEDLGFDVPAAVRADPRFDLAWTEGDDPDAADFSVASKVVR